MRIFWIVWFGQCISMTGSALTAFAIAIYIYQHNGSATQFALVALCEMLPKVLFAPLAGAFADRYPRRTLMLLTDTGAGMCTLMMVGLVAAGQLHIWQIYLLTTLNASLNTFQLPAYQAAMTQLAPATHMVRVSGFVQLASAIESVRQETGCICLYGVAGGGKTALALDIAHYYLEQASSLPCHERFDAIVWVTGKQMELLPAGLAIRRPTITDLTTLYQAIADVLDHPQLSQTDDLRRRDVLIARMLAHHRVLLILDNLEGVDDPLLTLFIRDVPAPSKVLITTRHRLDITASLLVHQLDSTDARRLLHTECQRHNLTLADDEQELLLCSVDGLPLALAHTVARIAYYGSSVKAELCQLGQGNLYRFCFAPSAATLRDQPAYHILRALAGCPQPVQRAALLATAGYPETEEAETWFATLERLALVVRNHQHFSLSPLMREWVLAE
jgi:hypothetical protein